MRPRSLGPDDPVGGYGGEAVAAGCSLDAKQPRLAGINFLNGINWGTFVVRRGCTSENAKAATALITDLFDRLERAARH